MGKGFYNTINATGQALINFEAKAQTCKDAVLELYKTDKNRDITPFEALSGLRLRGYNYPQNSVRRAISDLTDEGALIMLSTKRPGEYGTPNHAWKYNEDYAAK